MREMTEEEWIAFIRHGTRTATFVDDPEETLRVATDIGRRYMGDDLAGQYGERNAGPGQVTIEFIPTRVTAIHDLAG